MLKLYFLIVQFFLATFISAQNRQFEFATCKSYCRKSPCSEKVYGSIYISSEVNNANKNQQAYFNLTYEKYDKDLTSLFQYFYNTNPITKIGRRIEGNMSFFFYDRKQSLNIEVASDNMSKRIDNISFRLTASNHYISNGRFCPELYITNREESPRSPLSICCTINPESDSLWSPR
jgi:hypothetical protein